MPYNDKLATRIREILAGTRNVTERKMFGSLAFMVNNKLCVAAGKDRMMCRVDPATELKEGVKHVVMRGTKMKGYVYVDETRLKSQKALKYWIELSLSFNESLTKL